MWRTKKHRNIDKVFRKLPIEVVKKYDFGKASCIEMGMINFVNLLSSLMREA